MKQEDGERSCKSMPSKKSTSSSAASKSVLLKQCFTPSTGHEGQEIDPHDCPNGPTVEEQREARGQCPHCGQQLYQLTEVKDRWLPKYYFTKEGSDRNGRKRKTVKKVPLTIPRRAEGGQCLSCTNGPLWPGEWSSMSSATASLLDEEESGSLLFQGNLPSPRSVKSDRRRCDASLHSLQPSEAPSPIKTPYSGSTCSSRSAKAASRLLAPPGLRSLPFHSPENSLLRKVPSASDVRNTSAPGMIQHAQSPPATNACTVAAMMDMIATTGMKPPHPPPVDLLVEPTTMSPRIPAATAKNGFRRKQSQSQPSSPFYTGDGKRSTEQKAAKSWAIRSSPGEPPPPPPPPPLESPYSSLSSTNGSPYHLSPKRKEVIADVSNPISPSITTPRQSPPLVRQVAGRKSLTTNLSPVLLPASPLRRPPPTSPYSIDRWRKTLTDTRPPLTASTSAVALSSPSSVVNSPSLDVVPHTQRSITTSLSSSSSSSSSSSKRDEHDTTNHREGNNDWRPPFEFVTTMATEANANDDDDYYDDPDDDLLDWSPLKEEYQKSRYATATTTFSTGGTSPEPASAPGGNLRSPSIPTSSNYYDGPYNERGEKHGVGRLVWRNGDTYEGSFVNDLREGHGRLLFASREGPTGGKYVGEWRNNQMHGNGTRKYPNGDCYVGEYEYGKREGEGRFYYSNGDMYWGGWHKNQMNGRGRYYYKNGQRFEGNFVDGKRIGKGKLQLTDGRLEIFNYMSDRRVGAGILWSPDRTTATIVMTNQKGVVDYDAQCPVTADDALDIIYQIELAAADYQNTTVF